MHRYQIPVHVWLYQSIATRQPSDADLMNILSEARQHNARENITGMLLYHQNRFTQVIEGNESSILSLKARIIADPRHCDVTTLYEGRRQKRVFAHWSMAFHKPSSLEQQSLDAYMPLGWGKKTLQTSAETDDIAAALAQMSEWVPDAA